MLTGKRELLEAADCLGSMARLRKLREEDPQDSELRISP